MAGIYLSMNVNYLMWTLIKIQILQLFFIFSYHFMVMNRDKDLLLCLAEIMGIQKYTNGDYTQLKDLVAF